MTIGKKPKNGSQKERDASSQEISLNDCVFWCYECHTSYHYEELDHYLEGITERIHRICCPNCKNNRLRISLS
ncbi:MAG: hypothetical protein R6W84_04130 [Promethearchaeia archaeon]